ncbi:uncharacterized protein [Watersipora subatra]|uniref:uncharacterized protein n=1 Tax=Watersipora subatra TaxID=2589382 RepID=UPI00355B522C
MAIHCRITTRSYCSIGMIEGFPDGPLVASSLNQPRPKGHGITQCLNVTERSLTLQSEAPISTYTGVDTTQVKGDDPLLYEAGLTSIYVVPARLEKLFQAARPNCEGTGQTARLTFLLSRHSTVFSTGDGYLGRTSKLEHSISLKEGTRPIRQLPIGSAQNRRRRPKGRSRTYSREELSSQLEGAWSSPVVLVQKKDGKCRFCVDYRCLNAITEQNPSSLLRIGNSLEALSGSRYFSTLDLVSG